MNVETSTPPNTPKPIGPYNPIAKAGSFISIGGTAGVNPATGNWQILFIYRPKKSLSPFASCWNQ